MDMVGVGLTVLGLGIPAAVAIIKMAPSKGGASNGELRSIIKQLGIINSALSRLDERSKSNGHSITELNKRIDVVLEKL